MLPPTFAIRAAVLLARGPHHVAGALIPDFEGMDFDQAAGVLHFSNEMPESAMPSLKMEFSLAIFFDSSKRIFPDSGVPYPLVSSVGFAIFASLLRKHTRSQGPSLHRHYPASTVVLPCPTRRCRPMIRAFGVHCHNRTPAPQQRRARWRGLFDHLIGTHKDERRDNQSERLGGLVVDY
jgi:hypothetical protein